LLLAAVLLIIMNDTTTAFSVCIWIWIELTRSFLGLLCVYNCRECARRLASLHSTAPGSKQKVVYVKYSSPKLGAVSLYSPAKRLMIWALLLFSVGTRCSCSVLVLNEASLVSPTVIASMLPGWWLETERCIG
jgi:hypothetical protein